MQVGQPYMSIDDQEKYFERYLAAQRKQALASLETDQAYEMLRNKIQDLDKVLANFLDELVIARPMHKRADRIQRLLADIKKDLVPDLTNQRL